MLLNFISIFLIQSAFAQTELNVEGLVRTSPQVVLTEIKHCNCLHDESEVEQVLLATGLVYDVKVGSENGKVETVKLKEKWTTIPVFKFNSGGGIQQTTVGVYDPNVLGRRIELGAQIETLAGAPSVVFWNKVPRLFETKFFSDFQVWRTQRPRLKYDPGAQDSILTRALLQKSSRNYVAIGYEWNPVLKSSLGLEAQDDSFSTDRIPEETLNKVTGQAIPRESEVYFLSGKVEFGNLKTLRHSPIGSLTSAVYKYGISSTSSQADFQTILAESAHYKMQNDFIFASRLQMGTTNTESIQHRNYLGGFESIRGFVDNRFTTKSFWLLNLELRHFLIERESYIVQTNAFTDMIGIDEASRIENLHAASVGVGTRIILPYFYRLTMRFDYAVPVIKSDTQKVSFGVQQFF
jgi:hypothetical protein